MKLAKVSSRDIRGVMRIDGSFHLADANVFEKVILKNEYRLLSSFSETIFTSGRSRRFYTSKEKGYPYLSNSDVISQNPFSSCKYNSKKYAFDENALLKEGMIITGRVGAIGQTAYVTGEFEEKKAMGSDNIIRIVPKKNELGGFLYAFLASEIGNKLLWKLATGGVQPYITDNMLANIPVPIFPQEKQEEIHRLITEAARLRVEANRLLEEAVEVFEKSFLVENSSKIEIITTKKLKNRFDAFSVIENNKIDTIINTHSVEWISLKTISERIFIGPRSKRNYVKKGIPFLSGTELQKANPTKVDKFLNSKDVKPFIVDEGWLLITRSGTVGNVSIILPILDGFGATDDAIRVVLKKNSKITSKYLYAFLSSKFGEMCIQKDIFGSVIQHINEEQIGNLLIPVIKVDEIENKIDSHISFLNSSILKENQAISLVENEIALWQS